MRLAATAHDTLKTAGDEANARLDEIRVFGDAAKTQLTGELQKQAKALEDALDAGGNPDRTLAELKGISKEIRAGLQTAEAWLDSAQQQAIGLKSAVVGLIDQIAGKSRADLKGATSLAGGGIDAIQGDIDGLLKDFQDNKTSLSATLQHAIDWRHVRPELRECREGRHRRL